MVVIYVKFLLKMTNNDRMAMLDYVDDMDHMHTGYADKEIEATDSGVAQKRVEDNYQCDTSTGRWVREPSGPVYTNLTCPTLPDSKNCQKYGKDPDHLYWRWQPDGCDLPRSSPERFLSTVRGKRLAFLGDSLARNQMESLLCLLSQAETPTKAFTDDADEDGVQEWRFPAHGFTLMAITTRFLARADTVLGADGNPTASFDIHLDAPDPVWASRLPELDYAVFSTGNWFFRTNYFSEGGRRVGCSGCNDADLDDIGVAHAVRRVVRAALEATARCRDCKRGLVAFVRTYTPSHFEHGSWFDGGYCNRTRPLEESEAPSWDQSVGWELRRAQIEEVTTARKTTTTARTRFEVLDVTKAMMLRADGHPGWHYDKRSSGNANDCLHWCLPGPVDLWNDVLLYKIAHISPPAPIQSSPASRQLPPAAADETARRANVFEAIPLVARKNALALIVTCVLALPALAILVLGAVPSAVPSMLGWRTTASTMAVEEECDVSRGRWVRDPRGPIYTNVTCPTVADYVNCQKFGKDPGYLYWRWQPDGCDLPRFSPAKFLAAVRGKRLAFIGDSLARNHMESLLCLLSQAETPTDMQGAGAYAAGFWRWHFPEHEFTLMAVWTEFFVHAVTVAGGNRTGPFDIHLDRLDPDGGGGWTRRLPELDYAVISGGNWFFRSNYLWERGRRFGCVGCVDPGIAHFPISYAVGRVAHAALDAIAACRGCKRGLVTFLRTYTPDHFENGSWFSGGYCNRTRPLEAAEVRSDSVAWELRAAQIEEVRRVREKTAASGGGRGRFGLLDVTPAMMTRADGHPGEHHHRWKGKNANDCLHLCLPGPIDTWSEMLLRRIVEFSPPSAPPQ
uniref:Trichome birefringence-like N-terminal domain-containing protein n=1 Tax=Leersia perrieri TaxID=77586 RepID=A0A0D9WNP0_9ORYZ